MEHAGDPVRDPNFRCRHRWALSVGSGRGVEEGAGSETFPELWSSSSDSVGDDTAQGSCRGRLSLPDRWGPDRPHGLSPALFPDTGCSVSNVGPAATATGFDK